MQPIQERRRGTSETATGASFRSGSLVVAAMAAASLAFVLIWTGDARAQDDNGVVPLPAQAPVIPELPGRNPLIESDADEVAENENEAEIGEEEEVEETGEGLAEEDADEDEASGDAETADIPPVPARRTPPERTARRYDAPLGPPPGPPEWSTAEIADAKQQCQSLLTEADFEYEALEPIREGVCGAPAPISLESVTAGQPVAIRPAAKLTCNMASNFHRWMKEHVQPSARKHLGTEITGVVNVASYHCRTRYNSPGQRMSQHAFASALDLASFTTATGEQISVEKSWPEDTPESRFLKEIHADACGIFGTVLGPDANAAHSNHFHFDITKRRRSAYCR